MLEKAKHMTIAETSYMRVAEMVEQYAFATAVMRIPELPVAESVVRIEDYGPGRHAKAEFSPETSGYDYLYAELCRDHDAEKAKVRNRRRADRKHPENKAERMRKAHNRLERKYGYYSEDGGIVYRGYITGELYADGKTRVAEQIARADWELERKEIEEDLEYERFNAELLEFDRKWREEAKAEQEHMRKIRKAIEAEAFQEWLRWA